MMLVRFDDARDFIKLKSVLTTQVHITESEIFKNSFEEITSYLRELCKNEKIVANCKWLQNVW